MSIQNLTFNNFKLKAKPVLSISMSGNVLVLFTMSRYPSHSKLEPVFSQLAEKETRVKYAIMDLSRDRDIIILSRDTDNPITTLPHISLYKSGSFYATYEGKKNILSIREFIDNNL